MKQTGSFLHFALHELHLVLHMVFTAALEEITKHSSLILGGVWFATANTLQRNCCPDHTSKQYEDLGKLNPKVFFS